jgi:4-hydroxy-3-polyprenylbenzoate decarboxylase
MKLRNFLTHLEADNQLRTIDFEVDCQLEIATLCRHEFQRQDGGQALWFQSAKNKNGSVVANLFGSEQRILKILQANCWEAFSSLLQNFLSQTPIDKPLSTKVNQADRSTLQKSAGDNIDLYQLPALTSWPQEQKPYLSLALTVTRHPLTGALNVGLYRAQVHTKNRLAVSFSANSGAGQHLAAAEQLQQPLPIALVLGSDPVHLWAAAAPLPAEWNEFDFCQHLFAAANATIYTDMHALPVPADSELILAGEVAPGARCFEGPFGNHTGQYVQRTDCPFMVVTEQYQSADPIVPATVVGPPPSENVWLGKANEIFIRELLKFKHQEIKDLFMPQLTVFHGVSFVQTSINSATQVRGLINSLWQEGPLAHAKLLVVINDDLEMTSLERCWWRLINRLDGQKIYQTAGRVAIDATGINRDILVSEDQPTVDKLRKLKLL